MRNKLLKAIVREMEMGVLVLNMDKEILFTNPSFDRTFFIQNTCTGNKVSSVINDPGLIETIGRIIDTEDQTPVKVITQGKNGQALEVQLILFREKPVKGLIGFFHDITEEKRVEAIKRDFVANVSHELRTPLATIKGCSETLLAGAMDDGMALKEFLAIIDKHASRMTNLIEDLLTLSMLESQQIPLNRELIDIKGVVKGVILGFEKIARDKGLKMILDMSPDIPMIRADRVRIEQVFVNLVDNAIKYTNEGEIRIIAREEHKEHIRVDIKDTGIGIPEKDIPRIFERFYRVDKGRSRELGGTGLGLAIVKHIIQGHNGKIWVTSSPDKGTTFSFILPVE